MAGIKVTIENARIGQIRELKTFGENGAVISGSVAYTPSKFNKETEQWENEETIWQNFTVWNKLAVAFAKSNPEPGMPLIMTGVLKARKADSYTNKNGEVVPERIEHVLHVDSIGVAIMSNIKVTGWENMNNSGQQSGGSTQTKQQTKTKQSQPKQKESEDIFDDNDPFGSSDNDMFDDLNDDPFS